MAEPNVTYIAMVNILTDPPWMAGTEPTQEQLAQIPDIRKYIYVGQVQTKTATKRSLKKEN